LNSTKNINIHNTNGNFCVEERKTENLNSCSQHSRKIEKGARDFAIRFEDVMKELSNG